MVRPPPHTIEQPARGLRAAQCVDILKSKLNAHPFFSLAFSSTVSVQFCFTAITFYIYIVLQFDVLLVTYSHSSNCFHVFIDIYNFILLFFYIDYSIILIIYLTVSMSYINS